MYSTSAILDEVLCVIKTVARKFVTIRVMRAGMDVAGIKNVAHVNTTRKLLGTYTRPMIDMNDLCSLKMHFRTMNFSTSEAMSVITEFEI